MIGRFQLSWEPILSVTNGEGGSSFRWNDKYGDGEKEIPAFAGIEMRNPLQMMKQRQV
jgi:hypothetical protein